MRIISVTLILAYSSIPQRPCQPPDAPSGPARRRESATVPAGASTAARTASATLAVNARPSPPTTGNPPSERPVRTTSPATTATPLAKAQAPAIGIGPSSTRAGAPPVASSSATRRNSTGGPGGGRLLRGDAVFEPGESSGGRGGRRRVIVVARAASLVPPLSPGVPPQLHLHRNVSNSSSAAHGSYRDALVNCCTRWSPYGGGSAINTWKRVAPAAGNTRSKPPHRRFFSATRELEDRREGRQAARRPRLSARLGIPPRHWPPLQPAPVARRRPPCGRLRASA
ncbi:hypothetical protein HK405_001174 [Cladochytrium tenue]|nr:hypothetical protein HK405_001174 [Cladochytrium tenue]